MGRRGEEKKGRMEEWKNKNRRIEELRELRRTEEGKIIRNSGNPILWLNVAEGQFCIHIMMKPTTTFKELIVWQKAHQFVLRVYSFTSKFPAEEKYALTSQLRRAAVSIAANIAEGYGKRGKADKRRYLNIAQGSLEECKYFLLLAGDLKFNRDPDLDALLEEVSRLLNFYSRKISDSIK